MHPAVVCLSVSVFRKMEIVGKKQWKITGNSNLVWYNNSNGNNGDGNINPNS